MIARAGELRYRWEHSREEDDRLAMRAAWDIHITCTGAELFGQCPKAGDWERCTATVLCHETGDDDNHLAYRGACLGCGWISPTVHLLWHEGENGAAEDANDHAHPGWRPASRRATPPLRRRGRAAAGCGQLAVALGAAAPRGMAGRRWSGPDRARAQRGASRPRAGTRGRV